MASPDTILLEPESPEHQQTRLRLHPVHQDAESSDGTQAELGWPQIIQVSSDTPIYELPSQLVETEAGGGEVEPVEGALSADRSLEARTSRDRVRLLARKHVARALSREEDARLMILTERIRTLVPGVAEQEVAALESFAEKVASSKKLMDERSKVHRTTRND